MHGIGENSVLLVKSSNLNVPLLNGSLSFLSMPKDLYNELSEHFKIYMSPIPTKSGVGEGSECLLVTSGKLERFFIDLSVMAYA